MLYSTYNSLFPSDGAATPFLVCDVTTPLPEKFDAAKTWATSWVHVRPESMRPLDLSDDAVLLYILIHEFAHCGPEKIPENIFSGIYSNYLPYSVQNLFRPLAAWINNSINSEERQADLTAIQVISEKLDVKEIEKFVLYSRATDTNPLFFKDYDTRHDLALYIDSYLNGTAPPSIEDVQNSRNEIVDRVNAVLKSFKFPEAKINWVEYYIPKFEDRMLQDDENSIFILRVINKVRQNDQGTLSPLARRRLELFIEGMTYFAPNVVSRALAPRPIPQPSPAT